MISTIETCRHLNVNDYWRIHELIIVQTAIKNSTDAQRNAETKDYLWISFYCDMTLEIWDRGVRGEVHC
jgi:hypothetical protein